MRANGLAQAMPCSGITLRNASGNQHHGYDFRVGSLVLQIFRPSTTPDSVALHPGYNYDGPLALNEIGDTVARMKPTRNPGVITVATRFTGGGSL